MRSPVYSARANQPITASQECSLCGWRFVVELAELVFALERCVSLTTAEGY